MSLPKEGDIINSNVINVTGTAAGSSGSIEQNTEASLQQGTHENTTATSTPGVVIFPMPSIVKQNNGDPVLSNTSVGHFDYGYVSNPSVVLRGSTFNMWYTGSDGFNERIGYATSSDGVTWTRQNSGNPVMDHGTANDWDSFGAGDPWVIDDGGTLRMWYTGSDGLNNRIGYASSANGITWVKNSAAVLDLGDFFKFDEDGVSAPTVVKVGGTFYMWYMGLYGKETALGFATSNDGLTWTRMNNNAPVLTATALGTFDGKSVWEPSVTLFNGVYLMYYAGFDGNQYKVGVATSVDGKNWIRRNAGMPVLSPMNGKFDWRGVASPTSLLDGMTIKIWYIGLNATTDQVGYATGTISQVKGIYTSPPFDLSGDVNFKRIDWTMDTPSGTTATIVVRTAAQNKPWGTWFTPTNGANLGAPDGAKFQYEVDLTSSSIISTPTFKGLTLQYFSPVVKVEASVNGVTWWPCTGTAAWTCQVHGPDGKTLLRARAIDSTGTHSDVLYTNLTLNGDVPVGTITINKGATMTKSRAVSLAINATDSAGVPSMMLSEDYAFKGAAWENYATTKGFMFSDSDGYKTVYVRFKDKYGLVSKGYNATILLDMTPPNGTIMINNGTQYTTSRQVVLQISGSDPYGVDGAMISEDKNFNGLQPGTFADQEFFMLSTGDGVKTIYVRFVDLVGNYRDYSTSIILDTTPPTVTLKVNNGSPVTLTRMVNLTIDGREKNGIKSMMISNLEGFNGSAWEPYAKWRLWELTAGAGNKVVYIKLMDTPGLVCDPISDAIQYNPPPSTGIITINNGAGYTGQNNVTLHIELGEPGDVVQMQIGNDPLFQNSQWQPYEDNITWKLPFGDGDKPVFVRFLTSSYIQTESFHSNITLDTIAPAIHVEEPANATIFVKASGFLRVKATDANGIAIVEVCMDNGIWEQAVVNKTDKTTYDYTMKFLGKTAKGPHNVKVRALDPAGNKAEAQITVTYKPKEQKKGFIPFLDTSLMLVAVAMALVLIAVRKRK
jgi:predicted GH43/DUF377 family glycosyl hydrolase